MNLEIDWEEVRRDYPVTASAAYLNSAAAGPVMRQAGNAATSFYSEMMEEGDARWEEWLDRRERVRESVARFINAEPCEIAFTTNTSSGMNLIADALTGRGAVISCDLEFPVTTWPWIHRGCGLELVAARERGGVVEAEDVRRAMNARTGIIALSHVQYSNGLRSPLEEIGEIKGSHAFVVNASQSAGALSLDVKRMKIDALCATGHKWMTAGYGSGFVYLSRELLAETRPRAIGWLSVSDPFRLFYGNDFEVRRDAAARAEPGCPHFAGIFALGACVNRFMEIGTGKIEARVLELNRRLTERVHEAGWRVLSPLKSEATRSAETLVAAAEPKALTEHLFSRGIPVTEKAEGIRVSTHLFNNDDDIARLIEAMKESAEGRVQNDE
ncbi:MAG TPA: aminotransferase class V-fold PLP-dependent enzyme [Pyrinomonadaceae bacterium]|nr:aminotransferase class V-fold PLP-dependent enzyme [Pyrinomonadaceae bacterium]